MVSYLCEHLDVPITLLARTDEVIE